MSTHASSVAMELLLSPDFGDASSVAKELHARGLTRTTLHRTTVARHAKMFAKSQGTPIKVFTGRPQQMLSKSTKSKRVHFCRINKTRNWDNVMFSDRKRYYWKHPGVKVRAMQWVKAGTKPIATFVSNPQCVNVYAGITKHGVTSCHVVAGTSKHKSMYMNKKGQPSRNITALEYKDVLEKTLLPCGDKMFAAQGVSHWVVQQDNDPSHKQGSQLVANWAASHTSSPTLLSQWPPHSPDLNLIENCWSHVQRRVNAQGHDTFDNFMAAVKYEVEHIPQSMLRRLYKSMPKRLARVIELEGDRLKC